MVVAMTGSESDIQFVPYHEVFGHNFEDMSRRVPDIGKIRRLVGYEPTVHLKEILERVIEYWTPEPSTVTPAVHIPALQRSAALLVH